MQVTRDKKALITGITGQDGSYLAELLLEKGYEVRGIVRRSSSGNSDRIGHLHHHPNFSTVSGDLTDAVSILNEIDRFQPDEIYNLGAMSDVGISFQSPSYTIQTNTLGLLNILEYIRQHAPKI